MKDIPWLNAAGEKAAKNEDLAYIMQRKGWCSKSEVLKQLQAIVQWL
ncbi:MAG: hypothetical protein U1F71_05215 [Verrucomicrobiaceae bacterium]